MPKHSISIDDSLQFKSVNDARISPDGRWVAYTVLDVFKDETHDPKKQIWRVGTDGSPARVFTAGPRTDTAPRWSPDGAHLAFLSDRVEDGKPQIYLVPCDGGEAVSLTDVPGEILDLAWRRDGRGLFFLMQDAETEAEKKRTAEKDDAMEFERHPRFARVWSLDLATRQIRQVTQGDVQVWEFEESPDGRDLILLISDSPSEYDWYRPRLACLPVEGGVPQTIFTPPGNKQMALPRWSPDGNRLAFIACLWSDRGVVSGDLWTMDAEGGRARNLTSGAPFDISWYEWTDDGRAFVVMGYERGDAMIGTVDAADGTYRRWWSGEVGFMDRYWQHFARAGDTLAMVREDVSHPVDVWTARVQNGSVAWKQLTDMNPQADEITIGAVEKTAWKSRDGLEIQGFLVKPINYEPGRRYPLVTWVHGGPAGNHGPRYYAMGTRFQLLAAKGFLVLLPNPRGSLGWGVNFTESNVGDMGGMDWQDILAGVDYCIAQGWADEKRLGLAGWSYGGFMTAWGITQTDRFQAAMIGAGITNWLSFHGTSNLAVWDHIANAANPFERGGTYDRFSPMQYIANVKTPTLLLHGANDPYVPVGQAYEYFRALKDLGVPAELVVYPREGHGIREKNHQRDLMRRTVEWFERYLQQGEQ